MADHDTLRGAGEYPHWKIDNLLRSLSGLIDSDGALVCPYAIGDIYITESTTAPGTRWPGTTWEAYGAGRVIVGKASSGTFATAGATGGAETHTLSLAEIPSHTHLYSLEGGAGLGSAPYNACYGNGSLYTDYATTKAAGGGGAHNNLQPYIVAYIWKRTA